MLKHREPSPCPLHVKPISEDIEDLIPQRDWQRLKRLGKALVYLGLCVIVGVALTACTSSGDFQKLLEDVKSNCHTTIDAQLATTISGIGGSGHFQQECWPTGTGPVSKPQ